MGRFERFFGSASLLPIESGRGYLLAHTGAAFERSQASNQNITAHRDIVLGRPEQAGILSSLPVSRKAGEVSFLKRFLISEAVSRFADS